MTVKHARVSDAITLAYEEVAGDPAAPPLLLVHGIGTQMIGWRDDFLRAPAGRGLHPRGRAGPPLSGGRWRPGVSPSPAPTPATSPSRPPGRGCQTSPRCS